MTHNQINATFKLKRDHFLLDVDISLPSQSIIALFGNSGSGKTTLLRCIAGLEKGAAGRFNIDGVDWDAEHVHMPAHKRSCGYVFQEHSLFPHLDVKHNLTFALSRSAQSKQFIRYEDAIHLLGIHDLQNKMPSDLSGGQQQRIAIARALLTQPKLLLMDEPLASLDLHNKQAILPYLESIRRTYNIPIIYISHSPDEILRIAEHMIFLQDGKVLASGKINELLTRTDLPLLHLDEACSLISATLDSNLEEYALSKLKIDNNKLLVPKINKPIGSNIKIRIAAKDVSIALNRHESSSISNILPASITEICDSKHTAKKIVKLNIGGSIILAQLTAYSIDKLNLKIGMTVFAQIKSVALMG